MTLWNLTSFQNWINHCFWVICRFSKIKPKNQTNQQPTHPKNPNQNKKKPNQTTQTTTKNPQKKPPKPRNNFKLVPSVLRTHFTYWIYNSRIPAEKASSKSCKSKSQQISAQSTTFLQNFSLSTKAVSLDDICKRKMFSYQRKTGCERPENIELIQPSAP